MTRGGRVDYNSLGTKLTKRYSSGLTALVSYTWSKSIDTTSGIRASDSDSLFSQDGRCMLCDRGLSAFDNRQVEYPRARHHAHKGEQAFPRQSHPNVPA